MELRVASLITALTSELTVSPDKSLQGGLRAARRSVRLLNKLGRSNQVCKKALLLYIYFQTRHILGKFFTQRKLFLIHIAIQLSMHSI